MSQRSTQYAPLVERNTFTVQIQDGKQMRDIEVVYASFAACIERQANSLHKELHPEFWVAAP